MSEHAGAPHVHSFPACECGQTITSLLDTLSDTMRAQAQALVGAQQRLEEAERERNEALKIMVSSKLEPCTIHNAFQPGCVSCIVKKAMEADTLRADLGRAVEALKNVGCRGAWMAYGCPSRADGRLCIVCAALSPHPTPTTPGPAGEEA